MWGRFMGGNLKGPYDTLVKGEVRENAARIWRGGQCILRVKEGGTQVVEWVDRGKTLGRGLCRKKKRRHGET